MNKKCYVCITLLLPLYIYIFSVFFGATFSPLFMSPHITNTTMPTIQYPSSTYSYFFIAQIYSYSTCYQIQRVKCKLQKNILTFVQTRFNALQTYLNQNTVQALNLGPAQQLVFLFSYWLLKQYKYTLKITGSFWDSNKKNQKNFSQKFNL